VALLHLDTPVMNASTPQSPTRDLSATIGDSAHKPSEPERVLVLEDALRYLDAVKAQFVDKPEVFKKFLDIMKDFKTGV
jgi:histone deacetylase complex regulatory component SIN3